MNLLRLKNSSSSDKAFLIA